MPPPLEQHQLRHGVLLLLVDSDPRVLLQLGSLKEGGGWMSRRECGAGGGWAAGRASGGGKSILHHPPRRRVEVLCQAVQIT